MNIEQLLKYAAWTEQQDIAPINSCKEYNLWSERINNASSAYECTSIYRKLCVQKSKIKKHIFQEFIEKIVHTCCKIKYSQALALAENIQTEQQFNLEEYTPYLKVKKKREKNSEKVNFINKTFSQMFLPDLNSPPKYAIDYFIPNLGDSEPLDDEEKILLMNALIKDRAEQVFCQHSANRFFLYSQEKASSSGNLKAPGFRTLYIVKQSHDKKLGEGSFGTVYDVHVTTSQNLEKTKALKEYSPTEEVCFNQIQEAYQNFTRLQAEEKFKGLIGGRLLSERHLIMKKYNQDLEILLANLKVNGQFLNTKQLIALIEGSLKALNYLHSKRICHLDIKTSNVFEKDGSFGFADCDSLAGSTIGNVNYLLMSTASFVFLKDHTVLLKMIAKAKEGIHPHYSDGSEPSVQRNKTYTYRPEDINRLLDHRMYMDIRATGLVLLEAITHLQTISWINSKALFYKKSLNIKKHADLPKIYQNNPTPMVKYAFTPHGLQAIENAQKLYGHQLINLIFSMVQPDSNRDIAVNLLQKLNLLK